jgi:hypothetical protein
MTHPQAAGVERLAISPKQRDFDFFRAPSKPAGNHIASHRQGPPLSLYIRIVSQVRRDYVPQVFKLVCHL